VPVFCYSDGVVEAHNAEREMFGFPSLAALLGSRADDASSPTQVLSELATFTGADWEQEDDITLVELRRTANREVGESGLTISHMVYSSQQAVYQNR
jgi:serine phosphatase RsbU (regulator of sigma subunit)